MLVVMEFFAEPVLTNNSSATVQRWVDGDGELLLSRFLVNDPVFVSLNSQRHQGAAVVIDPNVQEPERWRGMVKVRLVFDGTILHFPHRKLCQLWSSRAVRSLLHAGAGAGDGAAAADGGDGGDGAGAAAAGGAAEAASDAGTVESNHPAGVSTQEQGRLSVLAWLHARPCGGGGGGGERVPGMGYARMLNNGPSIAPPAPPSTEERDWMAAPAPAAPPVVQTNSAPAPAPAPVAATPAIPTSRWPMFNGMPWVSRRDYSATHAGYGPTARAAAAAATVKGVKQKEKEMADRAAAGWTETEVVRTRSARPLTTVVVCEKTRDFRRLARDEVRAGDVVAELGCSWGEASRIIYGSLTSGPRELVARGQLLAIDCGAKAVAATIALVAEEKLRLRKSQRVAEGEEPVEAPLMVVRSCILRACETSCGLLCLPSGSFYSNLRPIRRFLLVAPNRGAWRSPAPPPRRSPPGCMAVDHL